VLVDLFEGVERRAPEGTKTHRIELAPYEYHWFRVGAVDNALNRSALDE
jgi:hypothetical protein